MKKTKLQVDFDYDFELFGITSSSKFHKLCWAINNQLSIRLIKTDDFEIMSKDHASVFFMHSQYADDSCEISLFKNKSPDNESQLILPEFVHFDFILKINGVFQTFATEELLKQLREVKYIEYIAKLSLEKLKSKDNFLY